MNCQQCEELLMCFDSLTSSERKELAQHTTTCAACEQKLAFIQVEQQWVSKIEQPEPVHAAALTQKIMQALPRQKISFSFNFLKLARVGFATGSLALFFWLGSEVMEVRMFHKPAVVGPVLNSSKFLSHPQQREVKIIPLTERLKVKEYARK